jgi:hypothetical protein
MKSVLIFYKMDVIAFLSKKKKNIIPEMKISE